VSRKTKQRRKKLKSKPTTKETEQANRKEKVKIKTVI
jgi:hypothetical protein